MIYADIAIPVPLHRTFTYKIPDSMKERALPGMRVVVPFKKKERIGYIIETTTTPPKLSNIKEIASVADETPILSQKLLKLTGWISDYYSSPIGEVCASMIPNLLNNVNQLGKKRRVSEFDYDTSSFHKDEIIKLNTQQKEIWDSISDVHGSSGFAVSLLHGVTGSGKTEIYLKLIKKVIDSGGDVILLVPEISLAPQLAGRVISSFGDMVAIYHSGLTENQRLNQWKLIQEGKLSIVVGTRSALFVPFKNLRLIIVDEEHDNSYKQEESPRYNARDTAIMRGKIEDAFVLLGSATPSIESLANAKSGKYHFFHLPERHGIATLPDIKVIDMRKEVKSNLLNPYLSVELLGEIQKTVKKGNQAILFLNRRGYANFYLCRDCGHTPECPNCEITLTFHKKAKELRCHYCDYKLGVASTCPKCRGIDFVPIGSGTEMIEELIKEKIPSARISRLDRDTISSDKKRRQIISEMKQGNIDILIGTQMVTKGHDFPNVTLVGVISADQSIHFPDFRSSERTFQLLTQVSGRAGRALHPGRVLIQTYSPDHPSIKSAAEGDFDNFISQELAFRKELSYPPFYRLANVKISGNKTHSVQNASELIFKDLLKKSDGAKMKLLGPAPAPLAMLGGKTRWQILIKSASAKTLAETLLALRKKIDADPFRGVQVTIDVDPVSTM